MLQALIGQYWTWLGDCCEGGCCDVGSFNENLGNKIHVAECREVTFGQYLDQTKLGLWSIFLVFEKGTEPDRVFFEYRVSE